MVPSPTEIKDISSPKSWVRSIALIGSNGSSEAILHLQPGILLTAEIQIARTNPPAAQSLFKLAPLLKGTVCMLQDGTASGLYGCNGTSCPQVSLGLPPGTGHTNGRHSDARGCRRGGAEAVAGIHDSV